MESNNRSLGEDMQPDETMPDTEHTTAETQSELPADVQPTESPADETTPDEPTAAAAEVADEPPAAEVADEPAAAAAEVADEAEPESDADAGDDFDYDAGDDLSDDEAEDEDDDDQPDDSVDETARIRRGVILEGAVAETSPTEVQVDLGEGVIGTVASRELERMDRTALEALEIGSPVRVYVLRTQGPDGQPVLSLARAEEEHNWQMAVEHHENQQVYFSKVAGYNKGGLIVRFGKVRGFVPASQVSRERQRRAVGESPEERWGGMVGEDIAVKVVEIDRARNRLILSERAASREWREKQKSRLLEELTVGEIRKGRVISLADFGAFVDLGGADGLVHLTELSWSHVTHPREILEVGQEVEAQVISVDRERKRIGLSLKRQENDPWQQVVRNYEVHQLVQATVTKLTKFGAFARLVDAPEIEGLIHISELADYRVSHPREVVLVGDVLTLRIVKIDVDQRRLGLSLRQVDSAKYMDQDWQAIADEFEQQAGTPAEPEDDAAEDALVAAGLVDEATSAEDVAADEPELADDAAEDALVAAGPDEAPPAEDAAADEPEPEDATADDAPVAAGRDEVDAEDAPAADEPESYEPASDSQDDDSPADEDAPESAEDET